MTESPTVGVLSGRRFVAEALIGLLEVERGSGGVALHDPDALRRFVERTPAPWLVIDLDEPAVDVDELRALEPLGARRIGFYDTFTARHAELAFGLGISILFSLTADAHDIAEAVFGERMSTATAAAGLSRDDLTRLASLTGREIEVLQHLAAGRPTKMVAEHLGITPHTVETHKRRLFKKLGVQQQAHAVALAVAGGFVAAAEPQADS